MLKKKLLSLFIMCSILLLPFQTYASETQSTIDETYNYYWYDSGTKYDWYWSDTPHYASNPSGDHSIVIFRLANSLDSKEFVPAYCCDLSTGITHGTTYRRINLEDSTYYDDTAAGHIRGIFSHGYWPIGTDMNDVKAMEEKANAWLDANNYPTQPETSDEETPAVDTSRIHNLTAAQAITATQAAIWYYSNTAADLVPYAGTASYPYTDEFLDKNVDTTEESDEYTKSNVELFYEYLIHQDYEAPKKILFANDHFVKSSKVESEYGDLYNVTLYFRLESPISSGEELTLKAALGSQEQTFSLTPDSAFQPNAEGYYTITFSEVSKEETENGIHLAISGYQMADDVYFYEAKPTETSSSRDASQNLVGYARGKTPVHAELIVVFTLATEPIPETPDKPETPSEPETPEIPNEEPVSSEPTVQEAAVPKTAPKTSDTSGNVTTLSVLLLFSGIVLIMNFKKKSS